MSKNLKTLRLGKRTYSVGLLQHVLPDIPTALFFAKAYKLSAEDLSILLQRLFQTGVVQALTTPDGHSTELQDYLDDVLDQLPSHVQRPTSIKYKEDPEPIGELLPHLWESAEIAIADSIQVVADKLDVVLDRLPSKEGNMVFNTMMTLNKQRATLGQYQARITRQPVPENLVILDVSGSMTERTIRTIVEDVVALSYKANAHLAIVSSDTFHWDPGSYSVRTVLEHAQYGNTIYSTLLPLFDRNWGTVVTIADYDSYGPTKDRFAKCEGSVQEVLDISLVNKPTFLAECVGTLAKEVRPLMIGNSSYVL